MKRRFPAVLLAACLLLPSAALAEGELWLEQTVYVPVYSHVYHGVRNQAFDLTATLSVRNICEDKPITVTSVEYHDTDGRLVRSYVKEAVPLNPLATREFIIDEPDRTGGSGAKFIVRWKSAEPVPAPLVETVMIGTKIQQGISFLSRGVVMSGKRSPAEPALPREERK